MKKIVIVSTYPEFGSRNIGDQLIVDCLIDIVDSFGISSVDVVWRADEWANISNKILGADHIFFACLAVRPNMHRKEYPYLKNIIKCGVPFSVVSAGTDLPVNCKRSIFNDVSNETLELLDEINRGATVITTRGVLTQEFFHIHGFNRAKFTGDVAFYSKLFKGVPFGVGKDIKNIVVSDPHRSSFYMKSFQRLIEGVRSLFPSAKVRVAIHGVNPAIETVCSQMKVPATRVYEDPKRGLEIYNDADLHVGYRVHGHVSALKRRIYSYLLEQDGRGCDYGLTINRKISAPNYLHEDDDSVVLHYFKKIFSLVSSYKLSASSAPADEIVSMIRADKENGFVRFYGLERQIDEFNVEVEKSVKESLNEG